MPYCLKKWLAFIILIFSSLIVEAQSSLLSQTVSINVNNVELGQVLSLVEDQTTGFSFSFNPNTIPLRARVTYAISQMPLSNVLEYLKTKYQIDFHVIEKQIILSTISASPLQFTVNGFVTDVKTGEALIGATIVIDSSQSGAITNGYGHYSIMLPYGQHNLTTSYLGYELSVDSIDVVANKELGIALKQVSSQLKEIIVESRSSYFLEEVQTGKVTIAPTKIRDIPAAFGEFDVIKVLETVPGITFQSDGSNFFSVRGGNKDQNLVLIDDAPIYNPTHLLGIYSSIVPDAINSVNVYRSDFPIAKGGRLSSVIDIKTKEGNKNKFSGWGNIGLVSTQLGLEGPFKKGKHSYILSGRLSRIKWLIKQENPNIDKFQFYDFTGKTNFRLNRDNRLYFSFYTGADQFLDNQSGLAWSNINGSIRWNKVFKKTSFMNLTAYGSSYEYTLHYNREQGNRWRSRIGEIGLKVDFNSFKANQELAYGGSLVGRTINPGNLILNGSVPGELIVSVRNTLELAGYFQHEIKLGSKTGFRYGLRASTWSNLGESFEYSFNEAGEPIDIAYFEPGETYKTIIQAEPRLTLSYAINKLSSVKWSYGRSVQNLHLISNTISPFTSFEVWLPSGPNIMPQKADQISLAYYYSLVNIGIDFRLEGYYKVMRNQIDYANHASTLLNPAFEGELLFGKTKAYGIEFQAKKTAGRVRGEAAYSLSKSKSLFTNINNGLPYNSNYDKPHQVNLSLAYDLGERVTVCSNFIYTSGLPFSSPTSFYNFDDNEIPVYGIKNNDRFPDYHRLDFNATFILNKNLNSSFRHSITVALFNIYSRKNPISINFNKSQLDDKFLIPTNLANATRVSSQTYLYRITPSVNYQFRF